MSAISSASAALAASLRSDAQPPLYSNAPLVTNINQLVASNAANGPQNVILATANVATPELAALEVDSFSSGIAAAVFSAATSTGVGISDLVKNSNDAVQSFGSTPAKQVFSEPLKTQLDDPSAPVITAERSSAGDVAPITPSPEPVAAATSSNNNNTNTDTVTVSSTYTAATGAYTAAASFTASASASGSGNAVSVTA